MDRIEEELSSSPSQDPLKVPDAVHQRIEQTLGALPESAVKKHMPFYEKIAAAAACLVFVFLVFLPNVSVAYAAQIEKIPVIGDFVRVVTIRNYLYSDPMHEMDIKVPQIDAEGGDGIDSINREVEQLTEQLMDQFYEDLAFVGDQGHGSIYVDYEVLTNTERWFTLKLSVNLAVGSSNSYFEYYHIDKATGETVVLADLFNTPDFREILTDNIREQMTERMKKDKNEVYWLNDPNSCFDCSDIDDTHNFYFNDKGDLVIPFDKYEVAPGSMGCPEFAVEMEDIRDIVKEEYQSFGDAD